jgi:glycosyltransferase involved in cell wall biosynthesis
MSTQAESAMTRKPCAGTVLMLLTNAYDPDPRVRQEALALIRHGLRVRLIAWDRDRKAPASDTIEGVEVDRIQLRSRHGRGASQIAFYAAVYLRIFQRAWQTSFDVVHCHDLDTLPIGFALGILKRRPVVYDAHESFPDMLTGSVPALIRRGLTWLENLLIRRIDLLITVGEKLRACFESRGARASVVIGNWKRASEFSVEPETIARTRRDLGIPDNALAIACITQLLGDRKLEELLDAADADPDVHVIVGGRGALEPLVRERAARNARIHYIGFVPQQEIARYTCAVDAVYYGFDPQNPNARFSAPNKLFEALAAGRPLITGDFGEIADVTRRAACGIVLPKYSARDIANAFETLKDCGVRARMAANAYRFGREAMSWERGEAILLEAYERLLRRGRTTAGEMNEPARAEAR